MTEPADREALAVVLHDGVCRDRCEPQAMGEYYRQADAILARWRLVPVRVAECKHEDMPYDPERRTWVCKGCGGTAYPRA